MNLFQRERLLTWVVPAVLVAVFVLLAVMQYRWSAQVSDAESTRLQTDLQNTVLSLRFDVEHQLSALALELQSNQKDPFDAASIESRIKVWDDTIGHPGLVADVYLWSDDDHHPEKLSRLDHGKFQPVDWPKDWLRLRSLLEEAGEEKAEGHNTPLAMASILPQASVDATHDRTSAMMFGRIDESIPLLVFPARTAGGDDWLLITLNNEALSQKVLPGLVKGHFGDRQNSEFDATVALVPTSGSGPFVVPDGDADAQLNLFGPPRLQGHAFTRSGGAVQPAGGASLAGERGLMRFDPIQVDEIQSKWILTARDRKGSLAVAVAGLRRRNFTLSFSVLLILAGAVWLLVYNTQRARRLAAQQMDFVTGVSHELRTPVAAILSAAENIADGVVVERTQILRYGNMIKAQARQLNHLVEQVLRFAAVRRAALELDLLPVEVPRVLNEVLESTWALAESVGCRVELLVEPNLPQARAEAGALFQCVQNLVTNAIKYSGEARWVGIHAETHTDKVRISVADHGIGINADEINQIFDPFYRSPRVLSTHVHGTGLGLSLARSIADAMHAQLAVRSVPGTGTTFTLDLPAMSPRTIPAGEPALASSGTGTRS